VRWRAEIITGRITNMADTINDTAANAASAGADRLNEMSQKMGEAGQKMNEAGRQMADNGSTIGIKMIEQAETNTREAFAAMRAAASAKDIGDVMRIQSEFLRDQGNRSMAQAREVGELIMQFGRDATSSFRPR
jgi:phasin family protein